ncbi:MAG: DUF1579 family protein [Betaproteobacteria bacterium]
MTLPAHFSSLSGEWSGTKRLYLGWLPEPEVKSASKLTIAKAARGSFELMDYTWKYDGISQEGLLLIGYDDTQNAVTIAWADSWHMSRKILHCTGSVDADGVMRVAGSYEAPPGPDWGWRIAISVEGDGKIKERLRIVMHNVSPEGKEELAVDADFTRV